MDFAQRVPHDLARLVGGACDPLRLHQWRPCPIRLPGDGAEHVVYWMARSQRATANAALETAIATANELGLPVAVVLRLTNGPRGNDLRHASHMLTAFPELIDGLERRGASVHVVGPARPERFHALLDELHPALVVCDDDVMPRAVRGRARVAEHLQVPLVSVDADVVVPTRVLDRAEHAARTIRPKLHAVLDRFAADIVGDQPIRVRADASPTAIDVADLERRLVAAGVPDRSGRLERPSGERAARAALARFVEDGLAGYGVRRNQPHLDGTSGLSTFLHFGHVSVHEVLAAVRNADAPPADVAAFVEELVVRRELGWNFVRHVGEASTSLACAPGWARQTLAEHATDPRVADCPLDVMEACATPDPLWNASQRQMMLTGTMHGYLRMYWAKQVLTWTPSPDEAYAVALDLHDRWSLDARDPNSIAGVAWAIGGVHDRAWPERPIFGKVRSMTLASTGRKFDSAAYIARWSDPVAQLTLDE